MTRSNTKSLLSSCHARGSLFPSSRQKSVSPFGVRAKIAHHRDTRFSFKPCCQEDGADVCRSRLIDDLRKFARYFRPYKKSLVTGIVCILASVVIALLIP